MRKSKASGIYPRATLTIQQDRFVHRYLVSFNATQAYLESFPKATRMTAASEGAKLLKHPEIRGRIDDWAAYEKRRLDVKARRALDEMAAIAFSNIGLLFDADGKLIPPNLLPWTVAVGVKKYVVGKGGEVRIEMHDKTVALKALGQHVGIFKEQVEVSASGEFADLLREARERSARARKG